MKDVLAFIGAVTICVLLIVMMFKVHLWVQKVNYHLAKGHIDLQHQLDRVEQRVILCEIASSSSSHAPIDGRLDALEGNSNVWGSLWVSGTNIMYFRDEVK